MRLGSHASAIDERASADLSAAGEQFNSETDDGAGEFAVEFALTESEKVREVVSS